MAIKRYTAEKDTTITNAFKADLQTRGTDANMGASDTLEVFSIYAQGVPPLDEDGDFIRDGDGEIVNTIEKARILIQFPVSDIKAARIAGELPAKDSVEFRLKIYNAVHGLTLPRRFELKVFPTSTAWVEGIGLDMDFASDLPSEGGPSLASPAAVASCKAHRMKTKNVSKCEHAQK